MNGKEKCVREAARRLFDCQQRVSALEAHNTPLDLDERRAAFEALEMARAEESRAYFALLSAKSNYVR